METVYNAFWSESFWLPEGMTWDVLNTKDPGVYYPKLADLLPHSIVLGLVFMILRYALERLFFIPFGVHVGGIKPKKMRKVDSRPVLEEFFAKNRTKILKDKDLLMLEKKTSLSKAYIQRWFRDYYINSTTSVLHKFCEVSWGFTFYNVIFFYGMYILWDKPWFTDTKFYWKGWPLTHVTNDVYWYYLISSGYYWSLMFTLVSDVKRKDFKIMATHHLVTLSLLYSSWSTNFVRIGTAILLLHDLSDSWGLAAKMAQYCKKMKACEILFGIFISLWIITRIFILSYIVIYSCWIEAPVYIGHAKFFHAVRGMLHVLQVLHIMWTYMLLTTAYQKLAYGELRKDERSDTEEELDDNDTHEVNGCTGDYSNNNKNYIS